MMDSEAKAVLDALQADAKPMAADMGAWLETYRAQLDAVVSMQGPAPPVTIVEQAIRRPDGTRLGLRLYRATETGPWPTLLFIHGGGFVAGTLFGFDIPLRWLAIRSGWQIAAVDYRLAPEHPFPAAPEDCMSALRFLFDEPTVGTDPARIAVGGDSAGGLLSTVVARQARDAGLPLVLQLMLYPNTDLRPDAPHASRAAFDGIVIRMEELHRSLDLYLGATDRTLDDVSPALTSNLAGLCPALLVTNEYDPLRDEAEAYGQRLRAAGVPVHAIRMEGMIHTAFQRGAVIKRGDGLITTIADALREATATDTATKQQ